MLGGDTAPVLEAGKHNLDAVTLAVEAGVVGDRVFARAGWRWATTVSHMELVSWEIGCLRERVEWMQAAIPRSARAARKRSLSSPRSAIGSAADKR